MNAFFWRLIPRNPTARWDKKAGSNMSAITGDWVKARDDRFPIRQLFFVFLDVTSGTRIRVTGIF
jgi:hypothetical protein